MASSKRKVAVQNFKREKTGIGKSCMIIYHKFINQMDKVW